MSKILIIEENELAASAYSGGLEKQGHEVKVVTDGHAGYYEVFEYRPDAVLLNLNLPEMSGLDILRGVRGKMKKKTPVFVAISSEDSEELFDRAISAGASKVLNERNAPKQVASALSSLFPAGHFSVRREKNQTEKESATQSPPTNDSLQALEDHLEGVKPPAADRTPLIQPQHATQAASEMRKSNHPLRDAPSQERAVPVSDPVPPKSLPAKISFRYTRRKEQPSEERTIGIEVSEHIRKLPGVTGSRVPDGLRAEVPASIVKEQLLLGRVRLYVAELRNCLPEGERRLLNRVEDSAQVEFSLKQVIQAVQSRNAPPESQTPQKEIHNASPEVAATPQTSQPSQSPVASVGNVYLPQIPPPPPQFCELNLASFPAIPAPPPLPGAAMPAAPLPPARLPTIVADGGQLKPSAHNSPPPFPPLPKVPPLLPEAIHLTEEKRFTLPLPPQVAPSIIEEKAAERTATAPAPGQQQLNPAPEVKDYCVKFDLSETVQMLKGTEKPGEISDIQANIPFSFIKDQFPKGKIALSAKELRSCLAEAHQEILDGIQDELEIELPLQKILHIAPAKKPEETPSPLSSETTGDPSANTQNAEQLVREEASEIPVDTRLDSKGTALEESAQETAEIPDTNPAIAEETTALGDDNPAGTEQENPPQIAPEVLEKECDPVSPEGEEPLGSTQTQGGSATEHLAAPPSNPAEAVTVSPPEVAPHPQSPANSELPTPAPTNLCVRSARIPLVKKSETTLQEAQCEQSQAASSPDEAVSSEDREQEASGKDRQCTAKDQVLLALSQLPREARQGTVKVSISAILKSNFQEGLESLLQGLCAESKIALPLPMIESHMEINGAELPVLDFVDFLPFDIQHFFLIGYDKPTVTLSCEVITDSLLEQEDVSPKKKRSYEYPLSPVAKLFQHKPALASEPAEPVPAQPVWSKAAEGVEQYLPNGKILLPLSKIRSSLMENFRSWINDESVDFEIALPIDSITKRDQALREGSGVPQNASKNSPKLQHLQNLLGLMMEPYNEPFMDCEEAGNATSPDLSEAETASPDQLTTEALAAPSPIPTISIPLEKLVKGCSVYEVQEMMTNIPGETEIRLPLYMVCDQFENGQLTLSAAQLHLLLPPQHATALNGVERQVRFSVSAQEILDELPREILSQLLQDELSQKKSSNALHPSYLGFPENFFNPKPRAPYLKQGRKHFPHKVKETLLASSKGAALKARKPSS